MNSTCEWRTGNENSPSLPPSLPTYVPMFLRMVVKSWIYLDLVMSKKVQGQRHKHVTAWGQTREGEGEGGREGRGGGV